MGWPVPARRAVRSSARGRRDHHRRLRQRAFGVRLCERRCGRCPRGEFSRSLPVGLLTRPFGRERQQATRRLEEDWDTAAWKATMECLDSEEAEAQAADAPPVTAQGMYRRRMSRLSP